MPDIEIANLTDRFMRRIHLSLNARSADFDRHQLGPAGGVLLLTLAEMEPVRLHELVARMNRDKSQMTRAVKVLESKGLIDRVPDQRDARASVLSLTSLGQKAVGELQQAVADTLADILAPLSQSEQEQLRALLKKIQCPL
ncbi:MarR family transcriptional regulator [uncultured Roseibium sp.]|uniref:MarR family winged helix-turn-helix transcriptional regulator n=1 Tax=uncultured Roseibium sp. TaxID=1936171 RepID=UPI002610BEDF|nr:MarR family transcriptional regulator [uncultured Roseibium sp.]